MKTSTLSLDLETLVELTPEDQKNVNGGLAVPTSSAMPPGHTGPVSSAKPPVKHKKKHHPQTVSSVMPTATAHTPPLHH